MSFLVPAAAYVAGVLSGHVVVSFLKGELLKLHGKLDALLDKRKTNVFPKG
jgi:hypothetical protein